jgi:WD40 repeat protein
MNHGLRLLATANHQDVDLWDVRTGKLVRSFLDHPGRVDGLAFSGDDRLLAANCIRERDDNESVTEVWLWDVQRGRRKWAISLGNLYSRSVVLSHDGTLVAVAGWLDIAGAGQVRLFETTSGRELARIQPRGVYSIYYPTFSRDGKMLAAICNDGVRLWTVRPIAKRAPK